MPGNRSVYRTPNTLERHDDPSDPHLTLEWTDPLADRMVPFDGQSEVGLITSSKLRTFTCCGNTYRLNSNWRIFVLIAIFLTIFLCGFLSGFFARSPCNDEVLNNTATSNSQWTDDDIIHENFGFSKNWTVAYNYSQEVRDRLFSSIDIDQMEKDLEMITKNGPHLSGSNENMDVRNYITEELKKSSNFMTVEVNTARVLISGPKCEAGRSNSLKKEGEDTPLLSAGQGATAASYLAYAPNATATGQITFAVYGRKSDFSTIGNIVNGTICLIRHGRIPRHEKVMNAQDAGCIGMILFAQVPANQNDPWVGDARLHAMSGNLMTPDALPFATGQVLPNNPVQYSEELRERNLLPRIPAISISDSMAKILIDSLNNCSSNNIYDQSKDQGIPDPFSGNVLKLGPTDVIFTMESCSEMKYTEISNVVGFLKGQIEPDRYVLVSSHYDSWGPGAIDPHSGTAVLLGLARAAGVANNRPRRSLLFVAFDAEEFGLLGSIEFVRKFKTSFGAGSIVGAINLDGVIKGQHIPYIRADPIMKQIFHESAKSVDAIDETGSLYDQWSRRSDKTDSNGNPYIYELDTSSDHAMLAFYGGVPTAAFQYYFDFEKRNSMAWYPTYHTELDSFEYLKNVIDPGWKALKVSTQLVGDAMLRLADSVLVPLDCRQVGIYIDQALNGLENNLERKKWVYESYLVDKDSLNAAKDTYKAECEHFRNQDKDLVIGEVNTKSRSWHFAGVRDRNDALVVSLQSFVQQPIDYASLHIAAGYDQSIKYIFFTFFYQSNNSV